MPTIIDGGTIVTNDDARTVLHDTALVVDGGRIAALGATVELLARYPPAERIGRRGHLVMPGFANTNTHFTLTLARGTYEDVSPPHAPPFTGGLAYLPLPELGDDEGRVMAQLGAVEAIRSGTTLVLENALNVRRCADALVETGLRFLLCGLAWDRANASIGQTGQFEAEPRLAEAGLARAVDCHARWDGKGDGCVRVGVAPWAPDMCLPDLLWRLRDLQDRLGAIATIHLNQIWVRWPPSGATRCPPDRVSLAVRVSVRSPRGPGTAGA